MRTDAALKLAAALLIVGGLSACQDPDVVGPFKPKHKSGGYTVKKEKKHSEKDREAKRARALLKAGR
ncbi:MAG: hypothetical protein K0U74_11315 [Alphaproteobacteria bacterium]|nr:hypothetical protein [Alphaproteobacteria bacterium]